MPSFHQHSLNVDLRRPSCGESGGGHHGHCWGGNLSMEQRSQYFFAAQIVRSGDGAPPEICAVPESVYGVALTCLMKGNFA